MPADPLRRRVDHDVRPVLDRTGQERRERVVDHERHAVGVGDVGDRGDVVDVQAGVADRLEVDGLGPVVDGRRERLRSGAVDEAGRDPELGQGVLEQVVRPAVEARAADDVVAGSGEVEEGQGLRGLAACEAEGADSALQSGDALLEHAGRGVHDPGVDVPELLEGEEPGGVVGVVEDVRGGGVDRDRPGVRGRVRLLAGVEGERLGAELGLVEVRHRVGSPG